MTDLLTLFSSGSSFVLFLLLHVIIFRFISSSEVLGWIVNVFAAGAIYNFVAIVVLGLLKMNLAMAQMIVVFILSFLIYGLLSFLYMAYIFGTSESSIRLRLIHEISKTQKAGISLDEILKRYNTGILLKRRLDRLVYAKNLVYDGKLFHIGKRHNFFLLMVDVGSRLRKILSKY